MKETDLPNFWVESGLIGATIGHCRASSYLGVVKVDKSNDWTLIKARCSEEEDQQRRCRVCHCEEEDQQRHAVTVLDRR